MPIDDNLVRELLHARAGTPPMQAGMGGPGGSGVEALIAKLTGGGGTDPMAPQGMGTGHPPPMGPMNPTAIPQPMPKLPGTAIGSMPEEGVDRSFPMPNPMGLKPSRPRGGGAMTPPGEGGTPYKMPPKSATGPNLGGKDRPRPERNPDIGGISRRAAGENKGGKNAPKPRKGKSLTSKEDLAEQIEASSGMKPEKKKKKAKKEESED